jgi:hypothetical protein
MDVLIESLTLFVFGLDGRSQRVDPDGPTGLWTTDVGGSTFFSR